MSRGDLGRLTGAVDLSALARPATAAPQSTSTSPYVIDVTEATFAADVVNRSRQVPVVLDFWASWCGPCKQLSPILERLADQGAGAWVLAKIDCDANPRLAQAAGVQGIPAVKAVVGGEIVGEFTGALPEEQVRSWIDQVLSLARGETPSAAAADERYTAAQEALARGDLAAAKTTLEDIAASGGASPEVTAVLAQIGLHERTQGLDISAARARAAAAPDDVDAALIAADLDVVDGQLESALDRLLHIIRTGDAAGRDQARARYVQLLAVLPPDDARVDDARRRLASALY